MHASRLSREQGKPILVSTDALAKRMRLTDEPDVSLPEFWRILERRKSSILACVAGCALLALLVSLLMTTKYESLAIVEINRENSDMLGLDSLPAVATDSQDYGVTLETQANVLRSDSLAFQVAEQLHLENHEEFALRPGWFDRDRIEAEQKLPLEKAPLRRREIARTFEKNLRVKVIPGTRMIQARFLNPDPQLAADIVNALVNDYLEQYFRTRYNATAQTAAWLSRQLTDLKSKVETSQKKLVNYQKLAGILGTDEAHNVVMAKLEELNKQLTAAETNRMMKETVYQVVRSGNAELIASIGSSTAIGVPGPSTAINPLALIQSLRSQEAELKVQYAQAATKYGSAYPRLVQMHNQLQEIDHTIRAEVDKVAIRAENDYLAAKNTEDMLRTAFNRQKAEANRLNDSAVQYTIMKREAESSRDLYEGLLRKLNEAGVLAGLRSTNIVVVDPARTTALPASPNYPLNLGLGLAAGLLAGVCVAFGREAMDTTLRTPEQVESISTLRVVGVVPELASGKRRVGKWSWGAGWRMISRSQHYRSVDCTILKHPRSHLAEAFRVLRTSLLFANGEAPPKVILITSALPQEGKTTVTLNSAIALAQQGAKVLLIDADLRRPGLHARLGVPLSPGLDDLLAGLAERKPEPIQHPKVPNLWILPAGIRHPQPAELFGLRKMREVLETCRERFDFVIIDSPPVLSVTDAAVVSQHADAVLLVVHAARTTEQALLRARDVLSGVNAKLTGVLVNRFRPGSPEYREYYGYNAHKHGESYDASN